MKSQDELWGNVFAKIKQYGLNKKVLYTLKSEYIISKIKYAALCPNYSYQLSYLKTDWFKYQ